MPTPSALWDRYIDPSVAYVEVLNCSRRHTIAHLFDLDSDLTLNEAAEIADTLIAYAERMCEEEPHA